MKLTLEKEDMEELQQKFPKASKQKIREASRGAIISFYETLWEKIEDELNEYYGLED